MRKGLFLLVVIAAVALPGSGRAAAHPVLVGKVGLHDAFSISLTFPNGKLVHSIPAGTYTIVVHDYSALHNFALGSVTQNRRIFTGSVTGIGTKTYTVKLTLGDYAYACSAHPQVMHGAFVVTSAP
ncbi:MAG TPA: hypothetical protein VKR23_14770 [Gaiellaceae bacterium]|nr:hypothetical protein [Gaiellaceae bacterium]